MDWDAVKVVLVCLLLAVLIIGLAMVIVYPIGLVYCRNTADGLALEWKFGLLTKCRVKIDDKWIPLQNWRYIEQ